MFDAADLKSGLVEVESYLSGLEYPVRKPDIIAHAKQKGASASVITVLEKLPDRLYATVGDLTSQLTKVGLTG